MRGTEYERELARKLYKMGWAVIRAPASGAKAKNYLYPDLVAVKNRRVLAIEVKTTKSERPIYISERQVYILKEWEIRAGAEAWIAVKVRDGRGWRFYTLEELDKTENSWKLDPAKGGLTLEEVIDIHGTKLNNLDGNLALT